MLIEKDGIRLGLVRGVHFCWCSGYVSCWSLTRPKHPDPAPSVICLPGFLYLSLKCVMNGSVSCLIGNNSRNCNVTIHPNGHISIWYYFYCIRECYFLLFFIGACFLQFSILEWLCKIFKIIWQRWKKWTLKSFFFIIYWLICFA